MPGSRMSGIAQPSDALGPQQGHRTPALTKHQWLITFHEPVLHLMANNGLGQASITLQKDKRPPTIRYAPKRLSVVSPSCWMP
jgi:hypothetical protein